MQDLQNQVEEYNDTIKVFLYVIQAVCNGELKYADEEADLSMEVLKHAVKKCLKSNENANL